MKFGTARFHGGACTMLARSLHRLARVLAVIALTSSAAVSTQAGSLGVSLSGHYVTYNDESILLVGDSGTQVAVQDANLDHRAWIDDLADRGIRGAHVWGLVPARQKQDGSVIENRYGYIYPDLVPWQRKTSGPLAFDQRYQWDLTQFDDGADGDFTHYWPRMRDMASYAKSKDIVLGVTLFPGWTKHDTPERPDWSYHPFNSQNGGHLDDNGGAVYIDTPGTEIWQQTYSSGWSDRKKTQWIWERYAKKMIDDLGSLGNVFFAYFDEHSYDDGNMENHFADFFTSRDMFYIDDNDTGNNLRPSLTGVMSGTFGGSDKNWNAIAGFQETPAKPYFTLEGEPYQGDDVRTAIWTFSMGGGHYFFHADERQETPQTGIMGYDPNIVGGDKGMYKRDWLGHASRFYNEQVLDLDSLVPHNGLTSSGTYAMADPGREYVVYKKINESANITVDLSAGGGEMFSYEWYDPRTGSTQGGGSVTGSGVQGFTAPSSNDWALRIWTGNPPDPPGPSLPTPVWSNTLDSDGTSTVDGGEIQNGPSVYVPGEIGNAFSGNGSRNILWDNTDVAAIFDSVWDDSAGSTIDLYFRGDHWDTHSGDSGLWAVVDRLDGSDGYFILSVRDGKLRFPYKNSADGADFKHHLTGLTLENDTTYRLTVRQLGADGVDFEVYLDGGAFSNGSPVFTSDDDQGTIGFPAFNSLPDLTVNNGGRAMTVGDRAIFGGLLQSGEWVDHINVYNGYYTPTELDTIPGDFDGDGDIDGFDFLNWQRGESPNSGSAPDLADWEANFGAGGASSNAAAGAVPEPSAMGLLVFGSVGLMMSRRKIVAKNPSSC